MQNIAIILAGGTGSRLGYDVPKQFFKVAGKTVIEHTVEVFEAHAQIDEIAIVSHAAYIAEIENMVLANRWKKVKKILQGGKERYESSLSAINAYSDTPNCNLIFHDAVRPLLSSRIIDDLIVALAKYNAVDVAVPATDTIIQVDESGEFIENIPNRNFLRREQTPQAFRLKTIKKAYEIGLQDPNFVSSDDCGTVVKYLPDEKVFVVVGEESNMKLTYKEDTYLLGKLFQLKPFPLQKTIDFNLLKNKVIVIFGENSGIGKKITAIAEKFGAKVFSFSNRTTNTNITNRKSIKKALLEVFEKNGKIDFVVNSAAILPKEPLVTMKPETIEAAIRANCNGMVYVAIESYEYLKQSQGQLLLYSSISYTRSSLYSSMKAAVVNFMQTLAQEWYGVKIRVNVIKHERTKNFGSELEGTLLSAETVAEVSLQTLLSDFTGQVIDIKRKK